MRKNTNPKLVRSLAAIVFATWAAIGLLLGSGAALTALALVMIVFFGTGIALEGYRQVRSDVRGKKYRHALIELAIDAFGVAIALVTLYGIVIHGMFKK